MEEEMVYSGPLRMAEGRADLRLNEDEHERLVTDVADFQHARALLEEPTIKIISSDGALLVLEIPANLALGATLKAAFSKQVHQDFSPDKAAAIETALDGSMNGIFGGFGKFWQRYTVSRPREDGQVQVGETVGLPDGQTADDPATRAEIGQLTGQGWCSKESLPIYYKSIARTVSAVFSEQK